MQIEFTVALIAAGAALIGTWSGILIQMKNSQLQTELAEKQIKNSYVLASMDKKLEAHQKAFQIWTKMASHVHSPYEVKDTIRKEAVEFWTCNCLYLDQKASDEFRICINNFYDYSMFLMGFKSQPRNSAEADEAYKAMMGAWNQIHGTDKYIKLGARFDYTEFKVSEEDALGEKTEKKEKA